MAKFARTVHRWVAPLFVLAMIAVVITGAPMPETPAQIAQQLLMLILGISGIVLFVTPFVMKARRKK